MFLTNKMNSGDLIGKEKGELDQINSIDIINNIKSIYIMQIIFKNLEKKTLLEMIKYNKNIKK